MTDILAVLPLAVLVLALGAALNSLWWAFVALRAKARLRAEISEHPDIRARANELRSKPRLSDADIEDARRIIEDAARGLSESDRRSVEGGIRQSRRGGEMRYIEDLVTGR